MKGIQVMDMKKTIHNACISIELDIERLRPLQMTLSEVLENRGIASESVPSEAHLSLAYGCGDAGMERVFRAVRKIAALVAQQKTNFPARIVGFDILEGQSTPFDYLVLALEGGENFRHAVKAAERVMVCRDFEGGFKSHVSLLRLSKSVLSNKRTKERLAKVIHELNSRGNIQGQLAPGFQMNGISVCVQSADQTVKLTVPLGAVVPFAVA
jgi:2'-5' RNA ligase